MNITIVGAGAMGSLFDVLRAEPGHSVTLIDVNAPLHALVRLHKTPSLSRC